MILPQNVNIILSKLEEHGFEAYLVGGCVRDILLGLEPHPWKICTSGSPEENLRIFSAFKTDSTGLRHGSVIVFIKDIPYEIITFRDAKDCDDKPHPDCVRFETMVIKSLGERDFTINAMAYSEKTGLIDPYDGKKDLKKGILRCVGNPDERFKENALYILKALHFSSVYGFSIEKNTAFAVYNNKELVSFVPSERAREELCHILLGKNAVNVLLNYSDVVACMIPEIAPCIGFDQNNRFHAYTVYEHSVRAVDAYKGSNINVKMALLLHDIGKPHCYTEDARGGHFYGHAEISANIAGDVVKRLRFDNASCQKIVNMIRIHDAQMVPTAKSVRRWLNKVGPDDIFDFIDMRRADILAHAPGTQADRLRDLNEFYSLAISEIEAKNCFSLKDLAINGFDLLEKGIPEGKEVGRLLNKALDAVIEEKVVNRRLIEYLTP